MSAEAIGIAVVIKSIIGVIVTGIVGFFFWITRMNHIKLQNTPTREEVQSLIDDKFEIIQADLGGKIDQLIAASNEGKLQRQETNSKLTEIDKKLAVFENDMEYIKKEVGEAKSNIGNLREKVENNARH